MHIRFIVQLTSAAVLLLLAIPSQLDALPAFTKKTGYSCASCHNVFPMLNPFGRKYKENGYKVDLGEELPDADHVKAEGMVLYKFTPWSGRFVGYLSDKIKNTPNRIGPFHEIELYMTGNMGGRVSYFAEVEAADEDDWEVLAEIGMVGVHFKEEFNVVAGWGRPFHVDPYQSLAEGGKRLTRSRAEFSSRDFGTAGQRIRDSTNQITTYGRLGGRAFYTAGIGSGVQDNLGGDDKDFIGRIAFDINDNIMIGAYDWTGSSIRAPFDLGFTRAGIDFEIQYDTASVFGSWMRANDDLRTAAGGSQSNDAFTIWGLYSFKKEKRPLVVPIVRYDYYTLSDGVREFSNLTLNLTYFPLDNIKGSLEYFTNLDVPTGASKTWRVTLLFHALY
jgi:hypothetical protein